MVEKYLILRFADVILLMLPARGRITDNVEEMKEMGSVADVFKLNP